MTNINYLAVLVSAVAIFALGGLWYSSALFSKRWVVLMGKSEEEMKAASAGSPMPLLLLGAFVCGLLISFALAIVVNHFPPFTALRGIEIGAFCWLGFAASTSFATALFSMGPKQLWLINSGYNLVSFVIAGLILSVWR
ncbi:MAG TPA: DUF1761 domain-containing protein [Thermoanaerobaculia bacterium]